MSYIFELPEVGEGVIEAELVKWMVQVGDTVQPGQPVCEIMTDKATMEINCPQGGIVSKLCGDEGEIFGVHTALLELSQDGSVPATSNATPSVAPVKAAPVKTAHSTTTQATTTQATTTQATTTQVPAKIAKSTNIPPVKSDNSKVLASPATRMFASQQGVDLHNISGTGKGGRITKDDVLNADNHYHTEKIIAPPAIQVHQALREDQDIKIVGLRRKIAEKMVESVQRAPHFTYVDEVDCTALVAMRNSLKGLAAEQGISLTYIPFIMKALVQSFQEFPSVNAVMNEDTFTLTVRGEVNIGIATDTPQGLYVPVIKNVEQKSILELAYEISELTQRTREGKVQLSELQGGTFTITSVGNIGGRFATPIINHPEVAILGVNQIHDRPMVIDGQVVARKMMYLSPSFDHRIIDGAVAARFVSHLKKTLENPASLLLRLK